MGRVFAVVTIALCCLTSCGGDPGADPDPYPRLSVCEEIERGSVSTFDCEGADLEGANLSGANLQGANLEGADLQGANFEGAKVNDDTTWPEGFDPVAAGVIFED